MKFENNAQVCQLLERNFGVHSVAPEPVWQLLYQFLTKVVILKKILM